MAYRLELRMREFTDGALNKAIAMNMTDFLSFDVTTHVVAVEWFN